MTVAYETSGQKELFTRTIVSWDAAGTYQSLALTLISAVVFWLIPKFLARDGIRPGNCLECNYDLRHATSNACPECGAIDSRKD